MHQLYPVQMKAMMKRTDGLGQTLLAMVASSGQKVAFDIVLAAVTKELETTEVRHPLFLTKWLMQSFQLLEVLIYIHIPTFAQPHSRDHSEES